MKLMFFNKCQQIRKIKMKRALYFLIIFFSVFTINAQEKSCITKFIKGNISEKTAAVKEASDSEIEWISNEAIDFCLKNKEALGEDRDLDTLAVAAILSISPDYIKKNSAARNQKIISNLNTLFLLYKKSSIVQIAVLNKTLSISNIIEPYEITNTLNEYLNNAIPGTIDSSVFKAVLSTIDDIGDKESFSILYRLYLDQNYNVYKEELEKSVVELIPIAIDEVIQMIHGADLEKINAIFELAQKSTKISKKNLCDISENVLNETILLSEDSSGLSAGNIEVQLKALSILDSNKWTRASSLALSYFMISKASFEKGIMSGDQFRIVITSLRNIAPLDSVQPLIAYLGELNGLKEAENEVPSEIILAVINTLGAIGDKAAFDSLLAVTYLDYEESVLTAAREALSGLRWQ